MASNFPACPVVKTEIRRALGRVVARLLQDGVKPRIVARAVRGYLSQSYIYNRRKALKEKSDDRRDRS